MELGNFVFENCNFIAEESFLEGVSDVNGWKLLEPAEGLKVPKRFSESIKDIDPKPMYTTFAMPFGKSRMLAADGTEKGHRYWPREKMLKFKDVINQEGFVGYKGHGGILESFRDPAVMWVSAVEAQRLSDGQYGLITKGYVYENGANRSYVKTGAISSASIKALVDEEKGEIDGESLTIIKEVNPLSFDFVENRTEGIRGTNRLNVSGEQAMVYTAEQLKAIAELTSETLAEHNPKLASELAKSNNSAEVDKLLDRNQELIKRTIDMQEASEVAIKCAKILGCEVSELPSRLVEFSDIKKKAATVILSEERAKVPESLKKLVDVELEGFTPNSDEEAKNAVEKAIQKSKKLAAQLGIAYDTENTNTGNMEAREDANINSVASPSIKQAILARKGGA